ncbi:MAG: TetR/AcrR family transcriptional regulator [Myxococcota bacterium]
MGRPTGKRNAGYFARRRALAMAALEALLNDDGAPATLKDLAAAAGVSVPTLKHYFGDRDGLLRAALAAGAGTLSLPRPLDVPPDVALRTVLTATTTAWREGTLRALVASGLSLGIGSPTRGPMVIEQLWSPLLAPVEDTLRGHIGQGTLRPMPTHEAALSLMSPVLMALIEQDLLGGRGRRPIDLDAFIDHHVHTFLDQNRA